MIIRLKTRVSRESCTQGKDDLRAMSLYNKESEGSIVELAYIILITQYV